MFEGLLLPWQQTNHLAFLFSFLERLLKFLANFTLLKYVKSQRSYGFLITKELIFGFQIFDLKDHFSASLIEKKYTLTKINFLHYPEIHQKFPSNKIVDSFFYFFLSEVYLITCYYYTIVCILLSETELYISIKV